MKGGGKKKATTTAEPPNEAPPPISSGSVPVTAPSSLAGDGVVDAVGLGADGGEGGNGGHGVGVGVGFGAGGVGGGDAVGGENENTQLQQREGEEQTRVEDLEQGNGNENDGEEMMVDANANANADANANGDGNGNAANVPPVDNPEDYYEVEAIRRKKIRKGETYYLVKWLGWPDAESTWEPLENLDNVPEVVAAFEESWKNSKHRKRRRKNTVYHTAVKKRLERSATPYSLRRFTATSSTAANNHSQSAPPAAPPPPPTNGVNYADIPAFPQPVIFADEVENNGDAGNVGRARHADGNRPANASEQIDEGNEENDYDPKLSELKASTANGHDADRLAIQLQDSNHPSGNGHMEGQPNGVCMESDQNGRCKGAKKRKSGSVKRFNKDLYPGEPSHSQNPNGPPDAAVEPGEAGSADSAGNNSNKNTDQAEPVSSIVRILRPINCSPALPINTDDVVVTFVALRSDGTEVMVDNQYLKTTYPLLLINFYEQHLRYCPTS